jgi:hypothetical protein
VVLNPFAQLALAAHVLALRAYAGHFSSVPPDARGLSSARQTWDSTGRFSF